MPTLDSGRCTAPEIHVEGVPSLDTWVEYPIEAEYAVVENNFLYNDGDSYYFRDGVSADGIVLANEVHSFQNLNDYDTIEDNIVEGGNDGFVATDGYGVGYDASETHS